MTRVAKAHAYGNDFLYVLQSDTQGVNQPALAREMCHRTTGLGADGLIFYAVTPSGASMRLFNADGSRAEVSGNGVRALGALLGMRVIDAPLQLTIHTEGGIKALTRLQRDGNRHLFRAAMGLPTGLQQTTITAAGETTTAAAVVISAAVGTLPAEPLFVERTAPRSGNPSRSGCCLDDQPPAPSRHGFRKRLTLQVMARTARP